MQLQNEMRVQLTEEGIQQEPRKAGMVGTLEKTKRGSFLVLWDGLSIPEAYDESFLQPATATASPTRVTTSMKNREIRRRRKFLHHAFTAVRHNPAHKYFVSRCARALGGSDSVTPELIAAAEQINGGLLAEFKHFDY